MKFDHARVCEILKRLFEYEDVVYSELRGTFVPLPEEHSEMPDPRQCTDSALAILHQCLLRKGEDTHLEPCISGWHIFNERHYIAWPTSADGHNHAMALNHQAFRDQCLMFAAIQTDLVRIIDGFPFGIVTSAPIQPRSEWRKL